ncbi:hypothetical protein [Roseovarius sp. Pro17]|uniref:hypothetical protein n=1 Tax=Roseovarius sp. Pro17 TaxID=3108175 RepID=UPI002D78066A|nr:hypothetical protein [Roseovarius sp. Pro17]
MEFHQAKKALATKSLDAEMRGACLAIIETLESLSDDDGDFLTLPFFFGCLKDDELQQILPSALSILSTFEAAVLEAHGYIDDPENGQLHLDDESFRELINTGKLAHPVSGNLVSDPMRHVHLYYSVRKDISDES